MFHMGPARPGGRTTGVRRRQRWHLVYYLLAAFDVFAVSLGLDLSHRLTGIYSRSLEVNAWWDEQVSSFRDLGRRTRAVKAATAELFVSHDAADEIRKMRTALAFFNQDTQRGRAKLRARVTSEDARALLADLDAVEHAVAGLAAEAASLRRFEYLIAALVLVMVGAATLYGRKLARRAQLEGADLTARVRERTVELEMAIGTLQAEIAQRERAENALRQSEERYRTLFERTPHPMWVWDLETFRFLAVNTATVEHYGYSREEFLAMTIEDIRPSESVAALREAVARTPSGIYRPGVWPHRKKDGTRIDMDIASHDVVFGERRARLVVATDVTERRVLEEQLRQAQKMEAVGRLAGGVAHDFNNILGVILGYGSMLKRRQAAAAQSHKEIDEILKATERASALTRQLLAFSRKQTLQPRVLDLNSVVANVEKLLRRLIGEDVRLITSMAPALGQVSADPGQLEQVLMNLAVNSRDAMPKGGVLTLETTNAVLDEAYAARHLGVRAGAYVMLAVSDTGVGMDERTRSRIFEPFFTTKEPGKGTGLGLATVHGIVEQSGGHIWVYSEPGHGTTFKIYFPRVARQEEPKGTAAEPAESLPTGSETILLVEDEAPLRDVIRDTLSASGYRVIVSTGPQEALCLASQQTRIHLVLSDVVMPGMSGPELARRLQIARPGTPVLYMSGYTDEHIGHHGVLDAETRFIQKPFTTAALLRKLREVLETPASATRPDSLRQVS